MRLLDWTPLLGFAFCPTWTTASSLQSRETSPSQDDPRHYVGASGGKAVDQTSRKNPAITKYFHEPGGDSYLTHYDSRYFHEKVDYDERRTTLQHMIRAYLLFFRAQGIETWIAHGTLLGWWWNGKMLPWDWDIDTQVSASSLFYMGEHLNQTFQKYTTEDGKTREYFIDVNPWIWQRERGDGMNIIDARWIDTSNGLYIDITGLSETHPDTNPGVWSCKNYHHYRTVDLYPLRDTVYEGVPARIPYAYDKILQEEYQQKALILTEYENHRWDPDHKEWLQIQSVVKRDNEAITRGSRSLRRTDGDHDQLLYKKDVTSQDVKEWLAPEYYNHMDEDNWYIYFLRDVFISVSGFFGGVYWGSRLKKPVHMWFCFSPTVRKQAKAKSQDVTDRLVYRLFPSLQAKREAGRQEQDPEAGSRRQSQAGGSNAVGMGHSAGGFLGGIGAGRERPSQDPNPNAADAGSGAGADTSGGVASGRQRPSQDNLASSANAGFGAGGNNAGARGAGRGGPSQGANVNASGGGFGAGVSHSGGLSQNVNANATNATNAESNVRVGDSGRVGASARHGGNSQSANLNTTNAGSGTRLDPQGREESATSASSSTRIGTPGTDGRKVSMEA